MSIQFDTTTPAELDLASFTASMAEARKRFREYLATVRPAEKRYRAKFRPGGENILRLIADTADTFSIEIPGAPTAVLRRTLERARNLAPLLAEVEPLAQAVRDTIFQQESECWALCTAYYSALKDMSRVNAEIAHSLKDAVEFFATGPRDGTPGEQQTPPRPSGSLDLNVNF